MNFNPPPTIDLGNLIKDAFQNKLSLKSLKVLENLVRYTHIAASIFIIAFFLASSGCVTIPLTPQEKVEYNQSMEQHPDKMIAYSEILKNAGRTL